MKNVENSALAPHSAGKKLILALVISSAFASTPLQAAFMGGENDPCLVHGGATDSDGDTIVDRIETEGDADNDGIPNYLDTDSDNDGMSDQAEYLASDQIGFGDWVNSFGPDTDGDGIAMAHDVDDFNANIACVKPTPEPADFNNDGIPDYLDPDIDNDGLLDSEEEAYGGMYTVDTDNDGLTDAQELELGLNPAKADTDGGGANDDWELHLNANPLDASDDASLPADLDLDNDGISNALEQSLELNRDSDNDGRSDTQEAGLPDLDNDGFIDDQTDANQNGLADIAESLSVLPDFDNDSIPDMLDVDSDQDGISDRREFNNFILPEGYAANPNDADGDGALNMLDLDSDNDGIFDYSENGANSFMTEELGHVYLDTYYDADGDGRVDEMQDDDADGIPDSVDHSYQTDEPDTDLDGIVDDADIDHAIRTTEGYTDYTTFEYVEGTPRPAMDSDGDGIEDDRDPDSNNDGGFDKILENANEFVDADGDGIPAYLDTNDYSIFVTAAVVAPPANAQPADQAPQMGAATEAAPKKAALGSGSLGLGQLMVFIVCVLLRRRKVLR